ncbi:pirin family protein [Marinomonas shanghaiensis]|uniref:pirin family protein n=1 Tax=Marinomonas shanghaiensis TaxID=2202418 RepID=UPI003A90A2A7
MAFLFNKKISQSSRNIIRRTRGHGHGPITRLMSPSDLGQIVKPFVFLDLFDTNKETINALAGMPLHPHSGIATVTRLKDNALTIGSGTLRYG